MTKEEIIELFKSLPFEEQIDTITSLNNVVNSVISVKPAGFPNAVDIVYKNKIYEGWFDSYNECWDIFLKRKDESIFSVKRRFQTLATWKKAFDDYFRDND